MGPEHATCNVGAMSRLRAANARAYRDGHAPPATAEETGGGRWPGWTLADPDPDNTVDRWSRHWVGAANPRCPDCRALNGPCPDAEEKNAARAGDGRGVGGGSGEISTSPLGGRKEQGNG